MRDPLVDYACARPGSRAEARALLELQRLEEIEQQKRQGLEHPLAADLVALQQAEGQTSEKLADYAARADVRRRVADYLETVVLPNTDSDKIHALPDRLRNARTRAWLQWAPTANKTRCIWDRKVGEPLLCPDDAREEAMRLADRLESHIETLARSGLRAYYGVLTVPNCAPGTLAESVEALWKKLRKTLAEKVERLPGDRRRKKDLPKRFPIVGCLAVLEAPLGRSRDWHPHLNVIFLTRGRLDWGDFWASWRSMCDFQQLKPGNVAAAMRELIKYSVRAVPEKSERKQCTQSSSLQSCSPRSPGGLYSAGSSPGGNPLASTTPATAMPGAPGGPGWRTNPLPKSTRRRSRSIRVSSSSQTSPPGRGTGSPPSGAAQARQNGQEPATGPTGTGPQAAPAMTEWTAPEWLEWWQAMKGRRRSRTFGKLYGLGEAASDDAGPWFTVGTVRWTGRTFAASWALLDSIPGDKSIPASERLAAWRARLDAGPPERLLEMAAQLAEYRQHEQFLGLTA